MPAFSSIELDVQSPTLVRVITDPVLSDNATFTVTGPGSPIVFNWVRLVDQSVLVLVLGAVPLTTVALTATDGDLESVEAYVVPADNAPYGMKVLEALTYAFGKQVQYTAGVPACVLKADLGLFDTQVYVSSTLGFPDTGWVRIGDTVLEYTSRTSQSFTLREPCLLYPKVHRGTVLYSEVTRITPDGAGFGTESL